MDSSPAGRRATARTLQQILGELWNLATAAGELLQVAQAQGTVSLERVLRVTVASWCTACEAVAARIAALGDAPADVAGATGTGTGDAHPPVPASYPQSPAVAELTDRIAQSVERIRGARASVGADTDSALLLEDLAEMLDRHRRLITELTS